MNKEKNGPSDLVTDISSNMTPGPRKDNKIVKAISTFTGKQPYQQMTRYCHHEKRRVNIEQPNVINQYNMFLEGADCMDENTSVFLINLRTKKWLWPLFGFIAGVAVKNAYQIHDQSHLHVGEYKLDALGFPRALVDTYYHLYRKSFHLQHYSSVVAAYITQQTICSLMVSITGLPRTQSDGVAYQDVKERRYIIAKNVMSF